VDSTFAHEFFDVVRAQGGGDIPADPHQHNGVRAMGPFAADRPRLSPPWQQGLAGEPIRQSASNETVRQHRRLPTVSQQRVPLVCRVLCQREFVRDAHHRVWRARPSCAHTVPTYWHAASPLAAPLRHSPHTATAGTGRHGSASGSFPAGPRPGGALAPPLHRLPRTSREHRAGRRAPLARTPAGTMAHGDRRDDDDAQGPADHGERQTRG
jgi:hypothetical protein